MNQEELKQRMIKLAEEWDKQDEIDHLFDFFIANGVTIRERGEWIKRTQYSEPECNRCGKCPKLVFGMLPDFCPNCGADMRGVKDESCSM